MTLLIFVLFGNVNYLRIFGLFLLISTHKTFAGGFQVNLQGIKQSGMANCGVALLSDNSLLFFNPGRLALLDSSNSITVGFSPLFPRTLS